ncbi:MAG TPA: DsbA family protein [Stellaceae bacterium]|nr:DsbA family protein [Stellaceae bacterium]
MRNIWWALAIALLTFAGSAGAADAAAPTLAPDDIIVGKADAPVTIFEYASLTCPHCAEFDVDILPQVRKEWIDTGKARLVFRDYPLDGLAVKAAMLAHCAPKDRFFAFVDELFHSQKDWVLNADPMAALKRIGLLGGVGPEKFDACMKDKTLENKILNERLVADNQYGVNSTPTFFVNGSKVIGALPYPEFSAALNAALGNQPIPETAAKGASTPAGPMSSPAGH